jgi:hypothetical protein
MANELRVIGFAAGRALGKEKGGFASVMARAGGDADSAFRGGTRFPACEVGTNFLPVFMRSKAHATLVDLIPPSGVAHAFQRVKWERISHRSSCARKRMAL